MGKRIFGVTELNEYIRDLLDTDEVLNGVYVRGEISTISCTRRATTTSP